MQQDKQVLEQNLHHLDQELQCLRVERDQLLKVCTCTTRELSGNGCMQVCVIVCLCSRMHCYALDTIAGHGIAMRPVQRLQKVFILSSQDKEILLIDLMSFARRFFCCVLNCHAIT